MATEGARNAATGLDAEARERSKALFGNMDTLGVLTAIALSEDGVVCAADLESKVGLANNRVRTQLLSLTRAGLLLAIPKGRDRIQWYKRLDSVIWEAAKALAEEWSEQSILI
jgi:predicted transcriptional regulator of viral defense system